MLDEIEGEQEQVAEITELPEEETPEPQEVKTFTQEEVDAIREEIKREEQRSIKGLQRVVSKKDQQIQELRRRPAHVEDTTTIELQLQSARDAEAERRTTDGEYAKKDPAIPRLEAELARRIAAQETAKMKDYRESIISGEREKLETRITEAGFDPDDERFEDAFEMWDISKLDGQFDRAHRKLDRILKTIKTPEAKAESNAETKRKEMLTKGTGKVDGIAGGGSSSDTNFHKRFASGELPVTQANIDRYNKILNSE